MTTTTGTQHAGAGRLMQGPVRLMPLPGSGACRQVDARTHTTHALTWQHHAPWPLSEQCLCQRSAFVRAVPLSEQCLCQSSAFVRAVPLLEQCLCQSSAFVGAVRLRPQASKSPPRAQHWTDSHEPWGTIRPFNVHGGLAVACLVCLAVYGPPRGPQSHIACTCACARAPGQPHPRPPQPALAPYGTPGKGNKRRKRWRQFPLQSRKRGHLMGWGTTCQHMSAHVSTCHHMSPHVSTCQHMSARHHMSAHVTTCHNMSPHVNTCQHMSAHVSTSPHVSTCQHMSARHHMSPHVTTCHHMSTHVKICHPSSSNGEGIRGRGIRIAGGGGMRSRSREASPLHRQWRGGSGAKKKP